MARITESVGAPGSALFEGGIKWQSCMEALLLVNKPVVKDSLFLV